MSSNSKSLGGKKTNATLKCPNGQIARDGYTRKAYVRTDGVKVSRSVVNTSCVKDMGRPGKTPESEKILPQPDDMIHLSDYGYSLDRSRDQRREALRKASKENNSLTILRRVNLIRNLSRGVEENYEKLSEDVKYLSNRYALMRNKEKRLENKTNSAGKKIKRPTNSAGKKIKRPTNSAGKKIN
jgi:hypothetical protein